jgi:hypothetical protein
MHLKSTVAAAMILSSPTVLADVVLPSQPVPVVDVEAFTGLPSPGGIDDVNPNTEGEFTTQGSAIRMLLSGVNDGDELTFDFQFATLENYGEPNLTFTDFGFFSSVNGTVHVERLGSPLGSPGDPDIFPSADGSSGQTDVIPATHVFSGLGGPSDVTISFGVMDVGDDVVESMLLVDNVALNGSPVFNGGFDSGLDGWDAIGRAGITEFDLFPFVEEVFTDDGEGPFDGGAFAAPALLSLVSSGNVAYVASGTTVVPLPAAAWLFLGALGALGVFRRRSA